MVKNSFPGKCGMKKRKLISKIAKTPELDEWNWRKFQPASHNPVVAAVGRRTPDGRRSVSQTMQDSAEGVRRPVWRATEDSTDCWPPDSSEADRRAVRPTIRPVPAPRVRRRYTGDAWLQHFTASLTWVQLESGYIIQPLIVCHWMHHLALRLHRPLWEVREGTLARLEPHKLPSLQVWLLERHSPWQPHLLANRSDCVSFVQDGSNETDMVRKSCNPLDKLKLLKHGTSQRSAAEQLNIIGFGCFHNTVGISRMNWTPPL